MSQAAQAHDEWADIPPRRPRREPVSWASAEDLEVLGGLGEGRVADWTVLTLEREGEDAVERNMVATERIADDEDRVIADDHFGDPTSADTERMTTLPRAPRIQQRAPHARRVSGGRHAAAAPQRRSRRLAAVEEAPALDSAAFAELVPADLDAFADATPPVAAEPGGRRTVVIRGQVAPMHVPGAGPERRRPAPRARDRVGHRPDRVAMWAVMLGVLLILVATMSAG